MREIRVDSHQEAAEVSKEPGGKDSKPLSKRIKKRRVAVFIDGSNFYFKMRSLIPNKMDFIHYRYRELIDSLIHSDERISYIGYYVGVVRDTKRTKDHQKTLELVKNQQKLFEQLRHQQIEVVRGYLLERDGTYFEKGVDVRLAVDIVTMAQEKQYDSALVVSSDTDLIPAMQQAIKRKRQVTHVGFEHQPSLALIRYASRSHLINRQTAERYAAKPLAVRRFDDDAQ